eukprot:CAMPEP_0201509604 /NCGR_PEP_ID=MMETSP0161_2-20130828/2611_1 /ASSEMBLY_ACC=CAM_ASM_000251 /TAXON_ID=180227 /ORGANISM="Neoparamoeba aestuarina, Strain SoJaBio B1-5/56/2" /LENGTH=186 /DNA_ID=CAMNT_0047904609 /DNA_START=50 /DNA_END=606 /DNA_ORIENTATION=-
MTAAEDDSKRILSVQSHVVHGYVGNKVAVFPMQLLGSEVDFINTVQFSNHTGYPKFTGERLEPTHLVDLFEGLQTNDLHTNYSYVLSGFIGKTEAILSLLDIVLQLKKENPKLKFFCDPVLGDNGKFYVPKDAVEAYKKVIGHADIITPNYFEMEVLSGHTLKTKEDALKACDVLHEKGVGTIIMT